MERKEYVRQIASQLKTVVPEAQIILFGSEARGDSRPDSDIDLLILLPPTYTGMEYVSRRSYISGILYEISLNSGIEISPIILPQNIWESRKTPFTVNVYNDGIRL